MKYISTFLLGAVLLTGCTSQYKYGPNGKLLSEYTAELSYQDHFSASGRRLTSVGAILKRDRENFHRYKRKDNLDRWGKFFNDKRDRDALERIVNDGYVDPRARQIILNDYPLVRVRIYNGKNKGDFAIVDIIDDNARKSIVRDSSTQYGGNGKSGSSSSTQNGSGNCPQSRCE